MECSLRPSVNRAVLSACACSGCKNSCWSLRYHLEGDLAALQDHGCLSEKETAFVIFECLKVLLEAVHDEQSRLINAALKDGSAGLSEAVPLLTRKGQMLLQVIQAFHAANIVHGDVKPANFLIKPNKHSKSVAELAKTPMWVKAIDFGCSQSVLPNQLLVRRSACRLVPWHGFLPWQHNYLPCAAMHM